MCIQDIKLVHEELKDGRDEDFTEAKRLLNLSERIYLLGFGFGDVNVSRLALAQLKAVERLQQRPASRLMKYSH
jgi:hypothetical protein